MKITWCAHSLKVDGGVRSIDFAPCGNKFAIACNDDLRSSYSVKIFNEEGSTGNFACQSTLKVDRGVSCLSYAPSGDILAVGDYGGSIHFFNAKGEKTLSPVRGHRYAPSLSKEYFPSFC